MEETFESSTSQWDIKDLKKIRVLFDRVIVKMDKAEEKTYGGIIIPEAYRERIQMGAIVAMGDGTEHDSRKKRTMSVKIGDQVIFNKHQGIDFVSAGEKYTALNERDLLGTIGYRK